MKFSREEVEKRINEIPMLIEQLKTELNQLLGYKSALDELEKENKPKQKEVKKSDG